MKLPLTLSVLVVLSCTLAQQPVALKLGARAPTIELSDTAGQLFSTLKWKGKSGLLVFFTGANSRPLLEQLAQLEQAQRDRGLQVAAIHYAPESVKPADAERQVNASIPRPTLASIPRPTLPWPILKQGGPLAQAYGVERGNAALYIDEEGVLRGRVHFEGAPTGLLEQKVAVWCGEVPPKMGWRSGISLIWDYAIAGTHNLNGQPRLSGQPPQPLPPAQAARELRTFLPDREFNLVLVLDDDAPDELRDRAKALAQAALEDWEPALPQLKFQLTTVRATADLVVMIKSPVFDSQDPNGIRTVCSYFRTLAENTGPREPMAQRVSSLARVSFDHGNDKLAHSPTAMKKLFVAAIGFALGLAEGNDPRFPLAGRRNDPDSVLRPGADDEKLLVSEPSDDDIAFVRHLWAHLPLKLCQALIADKKLDEAVRAAEFITPDSSQAAQAEEELKKARGN